MLRSRRLGASCRAAAARQPHATASAAAAMRHCGMRQPWRHATCAALLPRQALQAFSLLTSAMRAERLGSYSSRCTTPAAVPSDRAKSM